MLTRKLILSNLNTTCKRFISHESKKGGKRYIQTIPTNKSSTPDFYSGLNYSLKSKGDDGNNASVSSGGGSKWAKHSLTFPSSELPGEKEEQQKLKQKASTAPLRRSRASKFSNRSLKDISTPSASSNVKTDSSASPKSSTASDTTTNNPNITVASEPSMPKVNETKNNTASTEAPKKAKKPRRALRPRKALITLSPNAVEHLRGLLDQPEPQLIRIGVKNRGCSGLTYHLEYVTEGGKFDELIEQDGVKVLIDSKALFSIVGSEMDWLDDKLSSRFIFKNPNSKGTCGCGESFMV